MADDHDHDTPASGPSREPTGERDASGRFRPGNVTSRRGGNPALRRLAAAQAAVRLAATPAAVAEVLAQLHKQAIGGDTQAAVAWLRRTLGPERPPATPIALPATLGTAAEIQQALAAVSAALAAGEIHADEAGPLISALVAVRDSEVLARIEAGIHRAEDKSR